MRGGFCRVRFVEAKRNATTLIRCRRNTRTLVGLSFSARNVLHHRRFMETSNQTLWIAGTPAPMRRRGQAALRGLRLLLLLMGAPMTSGVRGSGLTLDIIIKHDDGGRCPAKIARSINLALGTSYKMAYIENMIFKAIAAGDPRFPKRIKAGPNAANRRSGQGTIGRL